MYDLSHEMENFYKTYVVLPEKQKNLLREKRAINEERLQKGLKNYNESNNTEYKIVKTLEQGSVAMGTVNANEKDNYDIDIGVIFDEDSIKDVGAQKIKKVVVESFLSLGKIFKNDPVALSNCVRVEYQDNYHIDFAIYKNDKTEGYLHAGPFNWNPRNPQDINNWFQENINEKGDQLRKTIRLCKMFSKSRESWNMPGGLVQTVLCVECFEKHDRLDKTLYETLVNIKNRLNIDLTVKNPVNGLDLIPNQNHIQQVENFKNRLEIYLDKLDILFETNCTYEDGISAWDDIFNHKFWQEKSNIYKSSKEEFIENFYKQNLYKRDILELDVYIKSPNSKDNELIKYNGLNLIPKDSIIFANAKVNISKPYKVLWKIRNDGLQAFHSKCLRGKILERNLKEDLYNKNHGLYLDEYPYNISTYNNQIMEKAVYTGRHYIEAYIIKNNECIARKKVYINIE